MNFDKKFWIAFVVMFVLTSVLGIVVHGMWLVPDYEKLVGVMRPEAESTALMHWMIIAHVFYAFGLCWVYRMGHDSNKDWLGQGVRFGIALTILIVVPIYLIYHVVAFFPMGVAVKQIIGEGVSAIIVGITLAFLYR